jgi:phosphatidylglycerophosphate synthase
MAYDGLVSRYLNRPLSRPAARALSRTKATPNGLTAGTFLLAIVAGVMVAAGWNIAGGILIQGASVADGIDGELARLKGMATRFGEVFDAITDRYADAIMLGGMAVFAVRFEELPRAEVVGLLAIAGSLTVSYSRARIEASLADGVGSSLDSIFGFASRDVRSLVAAVGAVLGQCYWALVIIAVASALTVAWRLIYLRKQGIGTAPS